MSLPTRISSTQLPTKSELLEILKNESQRKAVRFDFVHTNKSLFDAHKEVSRLAGSDDSWIDTYSTDTLEELKEKVDTNWAEMAAFIQNSQDSDEYLPLYRRMYTSLIPEEDHTTSDAFFVFGAATNARIDRAVQLYKQGVAPKIIISGKSPHYTQGTDTEARRMADYALENGVPQEALVLEEDAITLPDNVKRTIDLLESMQWRPASLTIITTNFVLARAAMEWYKFCPWDITIKPVAAIPQSPNFTTDGWYKDLDSIALVLNEYSKIILESKIDLMRRDGEIA